MGASHATAYMRACAAKLVPMTPAIEQLIQEGWEWTVFTAEAEREFKTLPGFVSLALNAANTNAVGGSEIETMVQMAMLVKGGCSMEIAVILAKKGEPRCKGYIEDIGFFASRYGGGSAFPLVHFVDAFGTSA